MRSSKNAGREIKLTIQVEKSNSLSGESVVILGAFNARICSGALPIGNNDFKIMTSNT